jgi:formate hydrogenlyase subunit 3/multisubunit Na+/H+ antiporter MnhD subunit
MAWALTTAILGLPLLASSLVVVVSCFARPSTAYRLMLAATGLTALLGLTLLPYTGDASASTVKWLPGVGAMGLAMDASGLYAALVTAGAAFLVLLGFAPQNKKSAPSSWVTMLLTLGAANVAFLTDHFLARYVALEVVALCVALAPLIELPGSATEARLTWRIYFLLRVGDAGLLAAILALGSASGTLIITPALQAGSALDGAQLSLVVAGFLLAAWVKSGGWPFHLWSQVGRRLSLVSQAWLYATVMPNLGMYLLYRVTPLLAVAGPLRTVALWVGACSTALAALLALTQADLRDMMVYVGAAQGGLALFIAAAGIKPAVWLELLAWTPVRLLLFLAAGVAQRAGSPRWHGVGAGLFGLGGLALVAHDLLITWWVRELAGLGVGPPLNVVFVAEVAVALLGIWAARATWQLALGLRGSVSTLTPGPSPHQGEGSLPPLPAAETVGSRGEPNSAAEESLDRVSPEALAATGLLGIGVLVGALAFGPLARCVTRVSYLALPLLPDVTTFLRYVVTAPALLAVAVLTLAAWRLRRHVGWKPPLVTGAVEEGYDLAEGLSRATQALRAVVEVGLAERLAALVVRAVVDGARLAWTVEHRALDDLVNRTARAVAVSACAVHRIVESEGLEGLLRRVVRAVLALSRCMQRWHTGRLRRNLLWLPAVLAAVVLALIAWGW